MSKQKAFGIMGIFAITLLSINVCNPQDKPKPQPLSPSFAKAAFLATEAMFAPETDDKSVNENKAAAKFEANTEAEKSMYDELVSVQNWLALNSIQKKTILLHLQIETVLMPASEVRAKGGVVGMLLADPAWQAITKQEKTCQEDFEELLKQKTSGSLPESCGSPKAAPIDTH